MNKKSSCIYCREQKIHPAFENERLCGGCASDLYEDYLERLQKHKEAKKAKNKSGRH
jgi:hypothetical protein